MTWSTSGHQDSWYCVVDDEAVSPEPLSWDLVLEAQVIDEMKTGRGAKAMGLKVIEPEDQQGQENAAHG